MDNGQPNELNELIAEPTLPIENGEFSEMTRIFDGPALSILVAGDQLIFEFIDKDGFTNGLSVRQDVGQPEFIRVMKQFTEYAGAE